MHQVLTLSKNTAQSELGTGSEFGTEVAKRYGEDTEMIVSMQRIERKQKGGFVKGRFWRMCLRSGFWYRGTSAWTLVPVLGAGEHTNVPLFRFLVPGNIRQNHPFGNHPCANPERRQENSTDSENLRW